MAGGSAINVQIKSGTNLFHGSAFEYFANSAIMANPFFLPAGSGKPKYIDNNFGGTLGGPIIHDRLFFFGSFDGTYNRQTGAAYVTVPTADIRAGNMAVSSNPIYDPQTGAADGSGRTAFPSNVVPLSRINATSQKLAANYPLPNIANLLTNNYYATDGYAVTRPKIDGKVNWVASNKLNISGRIGWLHYSMNDPPVFGDNGGGPVNSSGGRAGNAFGDVYSTTVSGNYVFRPTFVVDAYFGGTWSNSSHNPVLQDQQLGLTTLGLPGTNVGPLGGGWPDFQISSYSDIGTPTSSSTLRYNDRQYEWTGNASWIKGKHNIRFGVDISKYALNHYESTSSPGVFTFSGGVTTVRGGPSANQFNSFAQFLLGQTSSVVSELLPFDNNHITSRQLSYSFYGQDTWQASRQLTMSLGVRWDYFPMGTRATRGMERYDFNTNIMSICGAGSVPTDCGYHIDQKNFSPRVGIAWRPNDTTVVRSGFGMNYDPYPLAFVRNMLTNYPNDLLLTVNSSASQLAATQLQSGIPAIVVPDISSGQVVVPAAYATRSLPDNVVRGYIASWNFSVQKEVPGGFTMQGAYVGSRQVKITQRLDLNAGQVLGAGAAGQPYFAIFGRTTATELLTPVGHNSYDAFQASVQRRYTNGLSINLSYTFSKAMGICCDELSDAYPFIQIGRYMGLNRAVMPWDRTQNLTTSFLWELPFGKGKKWAAGGVGSKILGGWQINGLFAAYSGTPFTVTSAGTSLNAPNNSQRANLVKSSVAILGGVGPGQSFFDPLAFAPVTTPAFGTAGLDIVRGPGTINFDGSLFRNFKINERWQLQFRGEMLNATNTPHFSNPGNNVSNMVLNADGSIRSLGGYTVITSTQGNGREGIDQRMFRFGLRITF